MQSFTQRIDLRTPLTHECWRLRYYVPSGEILYLTFANEDHHIPPHDPHQALIVVWNVAEDHSVICLTWSLGPKKNRKTNSEGFSHVSLAQSDVTHVRLCFVFFVFDF